MIFSRSSLCSNGLITGNLNAIILNVFVEQVTRNDEGDDSDKGCDEQLPRPEVAPEEETDEGERRAHNATHRLGTEVQDKPRQETAETDE